MVFNYTDKKTKRQKAQQRVNIDAELAAVDDKVAEDVAKTLEMLVTDPRRSDWQENNTKITTATVQFVKDHLRMPTNKELSRLCGLSEKTISFHKQKTNPVQLWLYLRDFMRTIQPQVALSIYNEVVKGNMQAVDRAIGIAFGDQRMTGIYEDAIDHTNTVEIGEDEDKALMRGLSLFADAMEKEPIEAEVIETSKTTKKSPRKAKKTSKSATKRSRSATKRKE